VVPKDIVVTSYGIGRLKIGYFEVILGIYKKKNYFEPMILPVLPMFIPGV